MIRSHDKKGFKSHLTKTGLYNPMIEGVRWTENYAHKLEKLWKIIPTWLSQILGTLAVFLLASGLKGIWLFAVYKKKFRDFYFIKFKISAEKFKKLFLSTLNHFMNLIKK